MEKEQNQETQEIDYKAEYEKMVNQKEREEAISSFKESVTNKGYKLDEEKFSTKCEEYDNSTLKSFTDMIDSLSYQVKISGRTPQDGYPTPTNNEEKVTFSDLTNK